MARKDYYKSLEIERGASPAAIKQAYRKLAMKYHPDRTEGDEASEERFKAVKEAYEVLSDPKKRSEYDQFGRLREGFPGGQSFDGGTISDIFGDLFGDLFSGNRKKRAGGGKDLRYTLTLSFEEAAVGCAKSVRIPRKVGCGTCSGSGARAGSKLDICDRCKGAGEVRVQQGFLSMARACGDCHGEGKIITDPCRACYGTGRVDHEEKITVNLPPGVEDKDTLKVRGKGEEGVHGGKAGDLRVVVKVRSHPLFERDGPELTCELPISFMQATLGARVEVPTLDGVVRMKVPAGTQTGRVFRLKGKGFKVGREGEHGDLLVTVQVETPQVSKGKAERLLRELEKQTSDGHPLRKAFREHIQSLRKSSN